MSPRHPKQEADTIDVKYEPVFVLLQQGMNVKQAIEHIGMNDNQRVSFYRYLREHPEAKARMGEIKAKSNPLPTGRPKGGGAKKPLDIYGLMVKAYNEMNSMLDGSAAFHQGRFNGCFAIVKTYSDKYKDADEEKFIDFFALQREYPEFAEYMRRKEEIDAYLKGKKDVPDDLAVLDTAGAQATEEIATPTDDTVDGDTGQGDSPEGWDNLAGAIGLDSRSSATPGDESSGSGADITPGPGPEQDVPGRDVQPDNREPEPQPDAGVVLGPVSAVAPPRPLDIRIENGKVSVGGVIYGTEEDEE